MNKLVIFCITSCLMAGCASRPATPAPPMKPLSTVPATVVAVYDLPDLTPPPKQRAFPAEAMGNIVVGASVGHTIDNGGIGGTLAGAAWGALGGIGEIIGAAHDEAPVVQTQIEYEVVTERGEKYRVVQEATPRLEIGQAVLMQDYGKWKLAPAR